MVKTGNACRISFIVKTIPSMTNCLGTKDRHQLPNYYYRDDALDLWAAMEKYIGNIIRFFYHCEKVRFGDIVCYAFKSSKELLKTSNTIWNTIQKAYYVLLIILATKKNVIFD